MKIESDLEVPNGFGYTRKSESFDDSDMFSAYLKEVQNTMRTEEDFEDFVMVYAKIKIPVKQVARKAMLK